MTRAWVSSVVAVGLALAGAGAIAACGSQADEADAPAGVDNGTGGDATGGDATGGDGDEGQGGDPGAQPADDGGSTGDALEDGSAGDDASAPDAGADGAADAGSTSDDPFDPLSCPGAAITAAQALARLGAADHDKLADATLFRRTRKCASNDPATCGPWGAPVPHEQALLTYSGGVVTDYKTFSFPTHLILFAKEGEPMLSVRHASDYMHDATENTRGLVFAVGAADPMVDTYPIINVWDFAPAPNRYEDLAGLLGEDAFLHATESCARLVIPNGVATEIAALYRY